MLGSFKFEVGKAQIAAATPWQSEFCVPISDRIYNGNVGPMTPVHHAVIIMIKLSKQITGEGDSESEAGIGESFDTSKVA